jgi:DNA-binding transcriptional MerR regulator
MKQYTVKQLSQLSGVSVRTLHHYDTIGLLKPAQRTEARYRLYGRDELLRLQQILFYRELGFSLEKIAEVLDDPGFILLDSLLEQRRRIQLNAVHIQQLLITINKTIQSLENKSTMLTDEELYEGFPKGKDYRNEAAGKWGNDVVTASEDKLRKLSKPALQALLAQGAEISKALGASMHLEHSTTEVQELIAQHHRHICNFWDATEEGYRGLAELYISDERFSAYYNNIQPGLASFLHKSMLHFCDNGMQA